MALEKVKRKILFYHKKATCSSYTSDCLELWAPSTARGFLQEVRRQPGANPALCWCLGGQRGRGRAELSLSSGQVLLLYTSLGRGEEGGEWHGAVLSHSISWSKARLHFCGSGWAPLPGKGHDAHTVQTNPKKGAPARWRGTFNKETPHKWSPNEHWPKSGLYSLHVNYWTW